MVKAYTERFLSECGLLSTGDMPGRPTAFTHKDESAIPEFISPKPALDPTMRALDSATARIQPMNTAKSSQVGFLTSHNLLIKRMAMKAVAIQTITHVTGGEWGRGAEPRHLAGMRKCTLPRSPTDEDRAGPRNTRYDLRHLCGEVSMNRGGLSLAAAADKSLTCSST